MQEINLVFSGVGSAGIIALLVDKFILKNGKKDIDEIKENVIEIKTKVDNLDCKDHKDRMDAIDEKLYELAQRHPREGPPGRTKKRR